MALALQHRRSSSDLGRGDPLTDIERLRSQITALLDGTSDAPDPLAGAFVPMADVEETDDAYVVEIELPGVDRKDIDISVVGRRRVDRVREDVLTQAFLDIGIDKDEARVLARIGLTILVGTRQIEEHVDRQQLDALLSEYQGWLEVRRRGEA